MTAAMTNRKGGRGKGGRRPRLRHLAYLLLVSVSAILLVATVRASRLFADSSSFRLTALEVDGLRLLRGSEILEASGLEVGVDVFAVDLHEVSARVEALPWVKRALVLRKPPNRLVVSIVERRRVAWLEAGGYFGVDAEGVLLPARQERESHDDLNLPVIRGIDTSADSLVVGGAVAARQLPRLLDWWRQANEADAEFCLNVSELEAIGPNSQGRADAEIDWRAGGLRLRLVGDGLEVRLPWQRVGEQLAVLREVMARLYKDVQDPAYVDLRYAGQVVVGNSQAES